MSGNSEEKDLNAEILMLQYRMGKLEEILEKILTKLSEDCPLDCEASVAK